MPAHHRMVVLGGIPGDVDPGQVIPHQRGADKYLALRLVEPFIRGHHGEHICECGAIFANTDARAAHIAKRHPPAPTVKTKAAAPVVAVPTPLDPLPTPEPIPGEQEATP